MSIKTYTQILGAVTKFLEKGKEHCATNGIELDTVVDTSLYPDMLPFRFQIVSVAHHSLGAIEGVQAGVFGPPSMAADLDYEALQAMAGEAHEKIQAYTPDVVNALEGGCGGVQDRRTKYAVYRRRLFDDIFATEFLFPCSNGVRHPSHARRSAGQARLLGTNATQHVVNGAERWGQTKACPRSVFNQFVWSGPFILLRSRDL